MRFDLGTGDISVFTEPATSRTINTTVDYVAATKLIVKSSGNVGIGTTSPALPLNVYGATGLLPTSGTTPVGMIAITQSGGVAGYIGIDSNSPYGLWIQTGNRVSGFNTVFPILLNPNGGNVGIGTTSPNAPLEVDATSGGETLRLRDSSSSGNSAVTYLGFYDNANTRTGYVGDASSGDRGLYLANEISGQKISIATSNGNILLSPGSGSVGIGTNPSYTLDVNGQIHGTTSTTSSYAIYGTATAGVSNYGVYGTSVYGSGVRGDSSGGVGVQGYTTGPGTIGVSGQSTSGTGYGGYFSSPYDAIYVSGNGEYTGTWTYASDVRLKKDITPLSGSLEKLMNVTPVSFRWINASQHGELNGVRIGLTAQNVETVYPEVVRTDKDGYKSIAYSDLVAPLIQAVQEQQQQIDALKAIVCKDHPSEEICK
jgi:hypothetical protein